MSIPSWRIANVIMSIFFGLASYVQHNDSWAFFWIGVYALPCLVCLLVAANSGIIYHQACHKGMHILLLLYLLFSLYLGYRAFEVAIDSAEYNLLAFQQGKELFGVLIVASWLLLCIYFLNVRIPFDALMNRTAKVVILCLAVSPLVMWLYHGCFGQSEHQIDESTASYDRRNHNVSRGATTIKDDDAHSLPGQ